MNENTFQVSGNFETLNLNLTEDMKIVNSKDNKELGNIFYNKENETFTYLGYNGNIRSNINKNIDNYSRNFSLIKNEKLDYEDIQNNFIKSRILKQTITKNPYDLFIINLESRNDRKKEISDELKDTNTFNLNFLNAIKHPKGWIGCGLSHLYLVKYAKIMNLPYIIVAEDDFQLKLSDEKTKHLLDILTSNSEDWDIFNGTPTFFHREKSVNFSNFLNEELNKFFVKSDWGLSTSFIIYNSKSYDKILSYPFRYNEIDTPIDIFICNNFSQIIYKDDIVGIQRKSYSDISKIKYKESYENYFYKYNEYIPKNLLSNKDITEYKHVYMYWTGKEYNLIKILRELAIIHSNHSKNYTFHLLTPGNIKDYIDVPKTFFDMIPAHQADYVRVNILYEKGGLWLDSDTIVMNDLQSIFNLFNTFDGFFILENNKKLCNGVFSSLPNTPLMKAWKEHIDNFILHKNPKKIKWLNLGSDWLNKKENKHLFQNYFIFKGLDNVYPVNWKNCVSEYIQSPFSNYSTIYRQFQPFIVLINSVYKKLEKHTLENMLTIERPIKYFLDTSYKTGLLNYNKKDFSVYLVPQGGLGNQLFQIATSYVYSLRNKKNFYISKIWDGLSNDRPSYWDSLLFNLKQNLINNEDIPNPCIVYKEKNFSHNEIPFISRDIKLEGYFQSEKYFMEYRDEILSLFSLHENMIPKIDMSDDTIKIAIHVRRGDYLKYPSIHITMTKEYYTKAKQIIEEKLGFVPNYYYFSDDIEYTKEMFKNDIKPTDKFISGYKDYEELYIMSQCNHFIIANSTFSWWGAYLSSKESEDSKMVICPNPWFGPKGPQDFQNIYCKKWIPLTSDTLKSIQIKNNNWKENCDVYYINLEHRTDRKEQIESELSKVFSSFERFNAIKHSNGAIGCGKSHIEILKKGLTSDKDYICIFEDDFIWELQSDDVKEKLDSIFTQDFNIVLLSYHYPVVSPKRLSEKKLGFFTNCQTTSGYIINKIFIPILLKNFEDCVSILETKNNKNMAIDQNWKSLQRFENKFYVTSPRLGKQRPSYSDIEKKEVSYGGTCFMGILSCEKYKDRRNKQDLKLCPFEYRYFIGNPELKEAIENKEEHIVYLPCKDDYASLPQKVHEMLKWIVSNYSQIDYIFKTDDDIRFNFLHLIENFQTISLKKFEYSGLAVNCKEYYSDYLQKKDPSEPLIKVPSTKYCPGGGYFISKKCINILIEDLLKENTVFEDQSVGYCLNKHDIYPVNIKLQNYSCFW